MKRKVFLLVTCCMLFVATAFAALSADTAKDKAASSIPAGAKHLYTKTGMLEYEVQFINENTGTHYEIKVVKTTGDISESKIRMRGNLGSNNVKLSANDVRNIVLREYPNAVITSVSLMKNGGYQSYELNFKAGNSNGKMDINPENGLVMEKVIKYN